MPRPVFGEVDWFTFRELEDERRFSEHDREHVFATRQAADADELACSVFDDDDDGRMDADGFGVSWPGLEFCVARKSRRVIALRRVGGAT